MSVWSELFLLSIRNLTDLTCPSLSGIFTTTHAIGHSLLFALFVFKSTTWPTSIFSLKSVHFCRLCNVLKNSFFHLDQNSLARCWIFFHRRWLSISGWSKLTGSGMIALVFEVKRFAGDRGIGLVGSLSVSMAVVLSSLSLLLLLLVFEVAHRWGLFHDFSVSMIEFWTWFVAFRLCSCD